MEKTKVDCPKCLGIGEIVEYKLKKCKICKGEGKVDPQVEKAFLSTLHIFDE